MAYITGGKTLLTLIVLILPQMKLNIMKEKLKIATILKNSNQITLICFIRHKDTHICFGPPKI